ncbi:MAG: homoserine dehydrogenase [Acutalibacteraceae bacterium]|nr:homoserine dehydrogenase [Acutalibacteraceae bacterium]
MINVAIMGHGVVGSGVAEILINHSDRITEKVKTPLNVKYILDLRDFDGLSYSDKFIKDFNIILNDSEVKVVAEVMGGVNPAYDFVKSCLKAGKSVVTSNKELVAAKGAELIKIAEENNVNFLFEASVGGGIPILRPMVQCLAANEITEISGILNGTTNYILNKMIVDNMDFDSALKLAQDKGYAEKNPAADIEGHDACRKVCILAALGFGKHVYPEQVKTEGITDITLDDVEAADTFGCVIKLIGQAKKLADGRVTAHVRPTLVSRDHILSGVNGVFNAILVNGDQTGDVMFYGKGAGKEATASAVVADIMDCAKHLEARKYLSWEDGSDNYVANDIDEKGKLFVRLKSDNYDELVTRFHSVFGTEGFQYVKNQFTKEITFITEEDFESNINKKLAEFKDCQVKTIHTML